MRHMHGGFENPAFAFASVLEDPEALAQVGVVRQPVTVTDPLSVLGHRHPRHMLTAARQEVVALLGRLGVHRVDGLEGRGEAHEGAGRPFRRPDMAVADGPASVDVGEHPLPQLHAAMSA